MANLAGHGGWVLTLDWSNTGEYLLSGYVNLQIYAIGNVLAAREVIPNGKVSINAS